MGFGEMMRRALAGLLAAALLGGPARALEPQKGEWGTIKRY